MVDEFVRRTWLIVGFGLSDILFYSIKGALVVGNTECECVIENGSKESHNKKKENNS